MLDYLDSFTIIFCTALICGPLYITLYYVVNAINYLAKVAPAALAGALTLSSVTIGNDCSEDNINYNRDDNGSAGDYNSTLIDKTLKIYNILEESDSIEPKFLARHKMESIDEIVGSSRGDLSNIYRELSEKYKIMKMTPILKEMIITMIKSMGPDDIDIEKVTVRLEKSNEIIEKISHMIANRRIGPIGELIFDIGPFLFMTFYENHTKK
jgi:hypothetical protein